MRDDDRAKELFTLARRDLDALTAMKNSTAVAPEILGFLAQQAIEKGLKAWIAGLGVDYPLTHNIITLLGILEDQHCDIGNLWDLAKYNSFAVQFRYEVLDENSLDLDWEAAVARVVELLESIEREMPGSGQ